MATDGVTLTDEQHKILNEVLRGNSVFYTGKAGAGKSVLLRQIIESLCSDGVEVAVTAATGLAATHINGTTLHSFAGIGLGRGKIQKLIGRVRNNKYARKRWKKTEALLIDEISMVSASLFDRLERIARSVLRRGQKPFGGIQVIACGDFAQLEPVEGDHCFKAVTWNSVFQRQFVLTRVFRQRDEGFRRLLDDVRTGDPSPQTISALLSRSVPAKQVDKIHDAVQAANRSVIVSAGTKEDKRGEDEGPKDGSAKADNGNNAGANDARPKERIVTELYSRNASVEKRNREQLAKLPGEARTFRSKDTYYDEAVTERKLDSVVRAPKSLELKIGAPVMLLTNFDVPEGLVNGSKGVVLKFARRKGSGNSGPLFPKVRFENGNKRLMLSHTWNHRAADNEILASREQIPLRLAWALTIHKAQGMTLGCVCVRLSDVFADGQAYTALSRATRLEGIYIVGNVKRASIRANAEAEQFIRCLIVSGGRPPPSFAPPKDREGGEGKGGNENANGARRAPLIKDTVKRKRQMEDEDSVCARIDAMIAAKKTKVNDGPDADV